MPTAPSSSEPAAPWPNDVSADTAVIVAALERLVSALRDERAVRTRLRTALGDMHRAIATAKAVADSETAATLLDEFEHRVDAMIEIAGRAEAPAAEAAPVAAPAAETTEPPPEAAGAASGRAMPPKPSRCRQSAA